MTRTAQWAEIQKRPPDNQKAFLSVHPSGFEPETDGLENRCSIQLSYGCNLRQKYKNNIKTPTFAWIL